MGIQQCGKHGTLMDEQSLTCPYCEDEKRDRVYNMPLKQGLYFAKSTINRPWWDYIVEVDGEAPMLYIKFILDRGINGPRIIHLKPHEIACWGPMIMEPPAIDEWWTKEKRR